MPMNVIFKIWFFGHISTILSRILMGVKSKVSLWYQICSLGTKPNIPSQIYWTKFTKPNLQNWIYKIKSTNQNVFNAKNQIYQTKPIQSNLQNKINPIITIKPNLYKPNLQTVKVKFNSSLSWAWPSSAPACSWFFLKFEFSAIFEKFLFFFYFG